MYRDGHIFLYSVRLGGGVYCILGTGEGSFFFFWSLNYVSWLPWRMFSKEIVIFDEIPFLFSSPKCLCLKGTACNVPVR